MDICVYGIALNEASNVARFMESCADADAVYVCDTGSTDDTVRLLRDRGATVHRISVFPWRFDTARNMALDYVPRTCDVVVSLDLDEVLLPGWRQVVEDVWSEGVTAVSCPFTTAWEDPEQTVARTTIWALKVHSRQGYRWDYPVHEALEWVGPGAPRTVQVDRPLIEHHPDPDQPARQGRLGVFEIWENDYRNDERFSYFYAIELGRAGRWEDAERWARHFLELTREYLDVLPPLGEVRARVCRLLASCAAAGDRPPADILLWLLRSLAEAPWQREGWVHVGKFWAVAGDWAAAEAALRRGLMVTDRRLSAVLDEECWDGRAEKLLEAVRAQLEGQIKEHR